MDADAALDLRPAQAAAVAFGGGTARLAWGPRTGKTTALVHRAVALLGRGDTVLAVCRDRAAALRFEHAALRRFGAPVDGLTVATFRTLARDLAAQARPRARVLRRDEQRRLVATLLEHEAATDAGRARWPVSAPLLRRPAFSTEVADALLAYQASFLGAEELRTHAAATDDAARWEELAAFAERYTAVLAERELLDEAGALVAACLSLREPGAAAAYRDRHRHLLVDDAEALTFATNRFLTIVAGPAVDLPAGTSLVVAGDPGGPAGEAPGDRDWFAALPRRFAPVDEIAPDPVDAAGRPVTRTLVRVHHRAVEPEAVAGLLLAARADGGAWGDLAVLAPSRRRLGDVARALRRHGIPARQEAGEGAAALLGSPAAAGLLALLRHAAGDDRALAATVDSPLVDLAPPDARRLRRLLPEAAADDAALAAVRALGDELRARVTAGGAAARPYALGMDVWERRLGRVVVDDDAALEPVLLVLASLERHDGDLAGWLRLLDDEGPGAVLRDPGAPVDDGADAVTLTVLDAAGGRAWHTVVLLGCHEGELPRTGVRRSYYDRALFDGPDVPPAHERQRALLERERRRFEVACSRATASVVGIAAPEPGVLESRFVEGWERTPVRLPADPPGNPAIRSLPRTDGVTPIWPTGVLRLSATQLDSYENCGWSYAHQYALGVRSEGGISAQFGSMVHEIFERFLRPGSGERTLERLLEVADEVWDPAIFPYRPQAVDYRRRLDALLAGWWERDGSHPLDVVATEHRFTVPVGPHTLTGSIDRVDRDEWGLEIVDYKTSSKVPTDVHESVQLAAYQLAASRDPTLAELGAVHRLRLDYVAIGRTVVDEVTEDGVSATEQRILATADAIVAERFEPSPAATCEYCELQRLCPLQDEGREVTPPPPPPAPRRRGRTAKQAAR